MAIPIHLLNNSPPESSVEEFTDSEVSYSSEDDSMAEDEPSESENTTGGSHSSLSSLEREETDRDCGGTEEEFWVKYPYLKSIFIAEGISENSAYKRFKLIGDDKAKDLDDKAKALFIKELKFASMKLKFIASVLSLIVSGI